MSSERPRVTGTAPCLVVSDIERSVSFYCDKLGFVEPALWGDPPCFAMINRDEFDLMLTLADSLDRVRPHGLEGVWDLYIRVEDARAEADALRAAGVTLDLEPYERDYQMTELEISDPDGYRICIGSASE